MTTNDAQQMTGEAQMTREAQMTPKVNDSEAK